jgi:drug/metabolite transporter (DMT)-like permease
MHKGNSTGIRAALASAFFLGLAPIFGKQAIAAGLSPLAVVALRTSMAAGLLLLLVSLYKRSYLYIYPAGLLGCTLAGTINGLGSILYYMALGRLSASVGQLLYSLYPVFVAFWLILDRQPPSRMTITRIVLGSVAVILLTNRQGNHVDIIGVLLMLGAAALYALHLPINQRVLYDVPAPTVTLYTLIAMSIVVVPTYFLFDRQWPQTSVPWTPVIGLTIVTFLSRLSLFMGVKHIGGMQTAILGLGELLVTLITGHLWLHESLSLMQWLGAIGLSASLLLIAFDKSNLENRHNKGGWLKWLRPPDFPADIPWSSRD